MDQNKIVKDTINFIEENLNEELSLADIADRLNYSKCHLNRIFAANTGCTIYKYIQTRRLTEAARQLAETSKGIVEIAYEAHYGSQQAFTYAFHQLYLCSPQIYRQNGIFNPRQPKLQLQSAIDHFAYYKIIDRRNMAA